MLQEKGDRFANLGSVDEMIVVDKEANLLAGFHERVDQRGENGIRRWKRIRFENGERWTAGPGTGLFQCACDVLQEDPGLAVFPLGANPGDALPSGFQFGAPVDRQRRLAVAARRLDQDQPRRGRSLQPQEETLAADPPAGDRRGLRRRPQRNETAAGGDRFPPRFRFRNDETEAFAVPAGGQRAQSGHYIPAFLMVSARAPPPCRAR